MTTPASKDSSAPADAPFDPHDFPQDLLNAQLLAATLYGRLHALQEELAWSRDPHEGWAGDPDSKRKGRPATDGWPEEQAATYDKLWIELRQAMAAVQSHKWWDRCESEGIKGAALVAARMALKHADGAVPLQQTDVETAA
ncbi:hypothetical protein [Streptomyces sp. NPDC002952]|uniref:hypothetical protein n=1 Tax=Streptomyces sp. NPDC002952 TaxID=3364673 RepID=UPI00369E3F8A